MKQKIQLLTVFSIISLFFCTGRLGWLNIIDIRREVQIIVTLLLFIAFLPYLANYIKNPKKCLLILLTFLSFIFISAKNINSPAVVINFLCSVICVIILMNCNKQILSSVENGIIYIAFVLTIFIVIQFTYYLLDPNLFFSLNRPYNSMTGADGISIDHPIQILGFTVARPPVRIMNFEFPRFYSYASEPSTLVPIFIIPGYLAIYKKKYLVGLFILLTIIFFSHSGTIFLCVILHGFDFIFTIFGYYMFKYNKKSFVVITLLAGILLIRFIYTLDVISFSKQTTNMGYTIYDYTDYMTTKENSLQTRFTSIQYNLINIFRNPFGGQRELYTTMGLAFMFGITMGYLGIIIYTKILFNILQTYYYKIFNLKIIEIISLSGIIGSLMQSSIFTAHGWWCPAGFIILAIIYRIK